MSLRTSITKHEGDFLKGAIKYVQHLGLWLLPRQYVLSTNAIYLFLNKVRKLLRQLAVGRFAPPQPPTWLWLVAFAGAARRLFLPPDAGLSVSRGALAGLRERQLLLGNVARDPFFGRVQWDQFHRCFLTEINDEKITAFPLTPLTWPSHRDRPVDRP